jgi:hypothetical protein
VCCLLSCILKLLIHVMQLGFILCLWYPSTKWAQSVYAKVFSPLVSSYEADIDKLYMDGRTKVSMLLHL